MVPIGDAPPYIKEGYPPDFHQPWLPVPLPILVDPPPLPVIEPPPSETAPVESPPESALAPEAGPPQVSMTLEATDAAGNVLTEIRLGETFIINVYVEDLREVPQGVFAAVANIEFDPESLTPGERFAPHGRSGIMSLVPTGGGRHFLYSQAFTALNTGPLMIAAKEIEGIFGDILVFGRNSALPRELISFGTLELETVSHAD
jgi:hypothetical protein